MKLQVKDLLDTANAKDIYVTITGDCAIPLLDCDAVVMECTIQKLYANMNDVVISVDEDEFTKLRYWRNKTQMNSLYGKTAVGGITRTKKSSY